MSGKGKTQSLIQEGWWDIPRPPEPPHTRSTPCNCTAGSMNPTLRAGSWLCISGQHKLPPCHACIHLVHPLQDALANIPILTRFGSKQISSLCRQQLTDLRHSKSCMGMLIVSSLSYFPSNQDICWTHLCPTKTPVERNKSLESKLKYL